MFPVDFDVSGLEDDEQAQKPAQAPTWDLSGLEEAPPPSQAKPKATPWNMEGLEDAPKPKPTARPVAPATVGRDVLISNAQHDLADQIPGAAERLKAAQSLPANARVPFTRQTDPVDVAAAAMHANPGAFDATMRAGAIAATRRQKRPDLGQRLIDLANASGESAPPPHPLSTAPAPVGANPKDVNLPVDTGQTPVTPVPPQPSPLDQIGPVATLARFGYQPRPADANPTPLLPGAREGVPVQRSRTGTLYQTPAMGTNPILDAPHMGALQIAKGAQEIAAAATDTTPVTPSTAPLRRSRTGALYQPPPGIDARTKQGVADMVEGAMVAATPVVVAQGLAAPVEVAGVLAKATVASKAAQKALDTVGVDPDTSRLVSDVVGAAAAGVPLKESFERAVWGVADKTRAMADAAEARRAAARTITPEPTDIEGEVLGDTVSKEQRLARPTPPEAQPEPGPAPPEAPQESATPPPLPHEFTPVGEEPAWDTSGLETPATPAPPPRVDTQSIIDRINQKTAAGEQPGTPEAREADAMRRGADAAREQGAVDELRQDERLEADPKNPAFAKVPFPVADQRTLDALPQHTDFSKPSLQQVPIADLVATQSTVTRSTVAEKLGIAPVEMDQVPAGAVGRSPAEGVVVYQGQDGTMYLAGGHHTATAAWLRGEPTIQAVVYPPKPASAPTFDTAGLEEFPHATETGQQQPRDLGQYSGADASRQPAAQPQTDRGDRALERPSTPVTPRGENADHPSAVPVKEPADVLPHETVVQPAPPERPAPAVGVGQTPVTQSPAAGAARGQDTADVSAPRVTPTSHDAALAELKRLEKKHGIQSTQDRRALERAKDDQERGEILAEIREEYEKKTAERNEKAKQKAAELEAARALAEAEDVVTAKNLTAKNKLAWYVNRQFGEPMFRPVEGKPITIPALKDFAFHVHRTPHEKGAWTITEDVTGLAAGKGKTQAEAVEQLETRIEQMGAQKIADVIRAQHPKAPTRPEWMPGGAKAEKRSSSVTMWPLMAEPSWRSTRITRPLFFPLVNSTRYTAGGFIATDIRNVRPLINEPKPSTPITPKAKAEGPKFEIDDTVLTKEGNSGKIINRLDNRYMVELHNGGGFREYSGDDLRPYHDPFAQSKPEKPTTPVTPKAEGPRKTPVTTPEEKYDAAARGKAYEDMTDAELKELLDIGVGDEPQKAAVELQRRQDETPAAKEEPRLATKLYSVFVENIDRIPKDPRELRKLAAQITGETEQHIADHIDELNDAVEAALARQLTARLNGIPESDLAARVKAAQEIEAMLPRAHRSLEKTKLQQFSTPLPISVLAAHAAQVTKADTVLEPTAGTGNLLAPFKPVEYGGPQITALDISERRAALLKAQGYFPVTQEDYLKSKESQPTVIVTNPPWGKYSTGKYGRGVALGFAPSDVAERFVAKNMRDLADGGRLVAVMPTTMLDAKNFKDWLKSAYNVRAIIKSPPGSYDTRATSVDSVLLVVDKVPHSATLPKVVAAADWPAYIQAVEAIPERSPIRATEGRAPEAPRPAPERRPERVSGPSRPAGAEPRRNPPVGAGRPTDVVAEGPASGGREAVEFAGAADSPAPEPPRAPAVHIAGPSADTRREAADSRFFAPYVRRSAIAGQPHPKLLVEAKQLAGVPYPKLTTKPTRSMTAALDAGRVSVEQAEQALAVLQANSGEKPHGYLAADAVGVGKSREIAMTLLGAMDRAKAEKRPLRLMLTTKSRDNVEDLLDEIHFVASGKTAAQGGTVPFQVFRLADDYPGAKKTGNDYEALPKPAHAVYVVDSYNVAPFRQALVDAELHGIVGDEVQRFTNQEAQIGGAWLNLHARVMQKTPRPEQFFAYFTATPAQKVEDYRYLYGLRLWPVDGFPDWLELVTGALDEKKAKELEEATERGSVKPLDDVLKETAPDVVGGESGEGGKDDKKKRTSWQTYASNVFAQRLTPAEGEQIPREWKMLGRFSARDLWRKGTTFEIHTFKLAPEETKRYNQFVDLARDIMESAYKYGLYDKSGKASRFGVSGSLQFAAKRIQMQPALEEAVRLAKKLAADGYQPVFSIINVSEMSDQGGHLTAAVDKINTRMVDTNPDDPEAGYEDLGEIPEAVIDRARLIDRIRDLGAFPDPIEYLADELGKEKIAFIIGKEKASRRKASGEFQNGSRTYAVISGAGSTGINLDQRIKTAQAPGHGRRVFLDVQYEWSAMEAVQRYGRVDRASSIAPPRIIALTSGNASEKKFLATIANRMAALGALSKGGAEATGAAGNALEEFEITGDDALAAARRAYEESDDETKRSFATVKSAFRHPNRNGSNPDREDFDPFKPAREAHGVQMIDFQLPLLLMPMDQANAFWEKFIQYRDELRAESGEREAMRSARFSGEVLEKHPLKEHLDLYAVKNDKGQKFGILTGLVTQEMPKLRELLRGRAGEDLDADQSYAEQARQHATGFRRRYVTFTEGDNIITGLQVPWTRIAHIADAYGKAVSGPKLDTPEAVLAHLKAGETIRLSVMNPDSNRPWMLRYRPSDQRIAIDNARMADRTQLLQHGADYVPVGNYWRVKDLAKFLDRWPVPEQVGGGIAPKKTSASSGGGGGGFTAQSTILPGAKEFIDQDVTPALQSASEKFAEAKEDVRTLFAPDTVGRGARLFADVTRSGLAAHAQHVQRAQKVLKSAEAAFEKLAGKAEDGDEDAREQILKLTDVMDGVTDLDTLPPAWRPFAETMRAMNKVRLKEIQRLGRLQDKSGENYFGRIWKQDTAGDAARGGGQPRRPLEGRKGFLKKRTIDTFREGVEDFGKEPVTWNPIRMFLLKFEEQDKWIMGRTILKRGKQLGVAKFVRYGADAPEGWQRYHESFGTVYGPPTVPVKEAYDKPLMDGLFDFGTKLGITQVRKVKIGGGRWGYAVTPGDTVVTKVGGPEGVLMHEIGHILDERYGLREQWVNNANMRQELRNLADVRLEAGGEHSAYFQRYIRKGEEKIANLVHAFLYMPERTKKVAPNAYWALYNLAKSHKELRPLLTLQKTRSTALGVNVSEMHVGGLVVKGHYYGPPDAVRILNNYLSPGLRGNPAFDLYRAAGNVLNQAQLGVSGYHLTMTGIEAMVSKLAQGIEELSRGEFRHAGKSFAETPVATLTTFLKGHQALKEFYEKEANLRTIAGVTDLVIHGGGGVNRDKTMRAFDDRVEGLMKALRRGNVIGAALRVPGALFELPTRFIMNYWVPRLKLGAYLDLARMELRTLGPEPSLPDLERVLGSAWDSIDNRFGQLVYDNLFWHNALKDAGMGAIRALGWNVGTTREVFGAPTGQYRHLRHRPTRLRDTGDRTEEGTPIYTREKDPWLTHKMAYLVAMTFGVGLLGALYEYLHTGERPKQLRDYFFPRTGGTRADGRPERVSFPSYFKDVYAVGHDFPASAFTTAAHKLHPLANMLYETLNNEDYYGTQIRNIDDPWVEQLRQYFQYATNTVTPISVRSFEQRKEAKGQTGVSGLESFFGISPAPAAVYRSAAENKIRQYLPPGVRTQAQAKTSAAERDLRDAVRTRNRDEAQQAVREGHLTPRQIQNAMRGAAMTPLQAQFQHLSLEQAIEVYKVATPEERASLVEMLVRKAERASVVERRAVGAKLGEVLRLERAGRPGRTPIAGAR